MVAPLVIKYPLSETSQFDFTKNNCMLTVLSMAHALPESINLNNSGLR
jgi:hypothetical protein